MKEDIEYATEIRKFTKEWIEERIRRQNEKKAGKNKSDEKLTAELQEYYRKLDKMVYDLKK